MKKPRCHLPTEEPWESVSEEQRVGGLNPIKMRLLLTRIGTRILG